MTSHLILFKDMPLIIIVQRVHVYEKQRLNNINNSKVFVYYMLCTRSFSPALFNSKKI